MYLLVPPFVSGEAVTVTFFGNNSKRITEKEDANGYKKCDVSLSSIEEFFVVSFTLSSARALIISQIPRFV